MRQTIAIVATFREDKLVAYFSDRDKRCVVQLTEYPQF